MILKIKHKTQFYDDWIECTDFIEITGNLGIEIQEPKQYNEVLIFSSYDLEIYRVTGL